MSSTLIENTPHAGASTHQGVVDAGRVSSERNSSPWKWMALACLLLGISGGERFWRDQQFAKLRVESMACPFPLADLSKSLGTWQAIDDKEAHLDPEIARNAGSTDHILRTYFDSKSGEKIHVMVLYGLAADVCPHIPEICYPASGHQKLMPMPKDVEIDIPGLSNPARFYSQIYFRPMGPAGGEYAEVYYSFRLAGNWRPDMFGESKKFRAAPGMFKVQTSREVSAAAANPDAAKSTLSKSLVTEIVKDIERHLASAKAPAKSQG